MPKAERAHITARDSRTQAPRPPSYKELTAAYERLAQVLQNVRDSPERAASTLRRIAAEGYSTEATPMLRRLGWFIPVRLSFASADAPLRVPRPRDLTEEQCADYALLRRKGYRKAEALAVLMRPKVEAPPEAKAEMPRPAVRAPTLAELEKREPLHGLADRRGNRAAA